MNNAIKGALVATAVASLFANGALAGDKAAKKTKEAAKVTKCAGVNECKGHGACSGADNACKSKNECKGKGWVETKTDKECTDKGGTVVAAAPAAK